MTYMERMSTATYLALLAILGIATFAAILIIGTGGLTSTGTVDTFGPMDGMAGTAIVAPW